MKGMDMTHDPSTTENLQDIKAAAAAIRKLASNKAAFNEAHAAYVAQDASRFQAALDRAGIPDDCRIICRYFCTLRLGNSETSEASSNESCSPSFVERDQTGAAIAGRDA